MARLLLQRDQAAVRRQAARQPDATVAAQGANLHHAARAVGPHQELEKAPFLGLDGDGRQPARGDSGHHLLQDRIRARELAGNVFGMTIII